MRPAVRSRLLRIGAVSPIAAVVTHDLAARQVTHLRSAHLALDRRVRIITGREIRAVRNRAVSLPLGVAFHEHSASRLVWRTGRSGYGPAISPARTPPYGLAVRPCAWNNLVARV